MVSTTVEQLGLVTMAPLPPRSFACARRSARWSALTSGTRSGTVGSMRWLRALLTTKWPASAKARSSSPATPASSAENTSRGPTPGVAGSTVRSPIPSGMGVSSRHDAASA